MKRKLGEVDNLQMDSSNLHEHNAHLLPALLDQVVSTTSFFTHFSLKDLAIIELVSKAWKHKIRSDARLWRVLDLGQIPSHISNDRRNQLAIRLIQRVKDVVRFIVVGEVRVESNVLKEILSECENLQGIHINSNATEIENLDLPTSINKELSLSFFTPEDDSLLPSVLANQEYVVRGVSIEFETEFVHYGPPEVEYGIVAEETELFCTNLGEGLVFCSSTLTSFSITGYYNIEEEQYESLMEVLAGVPGLTSLTVSGIVTEDFSNGLEPCHLIQGVVDKILPLNRLQKLDLTDNCLGMDMDSENELSDISELVSGLQLSGNTSLVSLDLRYNHHLSAEDGEEMLPLLLEDPGRWESFGGLPLSRLWDNTLRKLALSTSDLGHFELSVWSKWLQNFTTGLKTLTVDKDEFLTTNFFEALHGTTSLTDLRIRDERSLTRDTLHRLANLVKQNANISNLSVNFCYKDFGNMAWFCRIITQSSSLHTINFAFIRQPPHQLVRTQDSDHFKTIGQMLLLNKSIKVFSLRVLGDQTLTSVASMVEDFSHNSTLTSFAFNTTRCPFNQLADAPRFYAALRQAMKQNSTLTKLQLQGHQMLPENGSMLLDGLRYNTTLKELDLCGNCLGSEGVAIDEAIRGAEQFFQHVALLLKQNNLESLNLCNNRLGSSDLSLLFDGLKQNTSLVSLDLGHNRLTPSHVQLIVNGLEQNSTLTLLNLKGTKLYPSDFDSHDLPGGLTLKM